MCVCGEGGGLGLRGFGVLSFFPPVSPAHQSHVTLWPYQRLPLATESFIQAAFIATFPRRRGEGEWALGARLAIRVPVVSAGHANFGTLKTQAGQ